MSRNEIRNLADGLSAIQAKIVMIRGFSSEGTLLYQRDFATILRRPLTTVNYNIGVLKKRGLMTQLNLLTPDGKVLFQKLRGYYDNTKKLRAHKIFGRFNISGEFRDFENVRGKFLRISNNPKHRGFRVQFKDCVVLFYSPCKIVFYLPDVYANSIEEIHAVAYDEYILPLQGYLEQTFEGLKINRYEICSVTINHLSLRYNPLADVFAHFGVRYVSDRIEVDHSHGVPESETIHKKYSVQDMDKVLEWEKIVRTSVSCRMVNNKEIKRVLLEDVLYDERAADNGE